MINVNSKITEITGKSALPRKSVHMIDWLSWYRGNVKKFHNYYAYNGLNYIATDRKTLGMAKFGCETWASLLLNEKCDIVIPGTSDKKTLDRALKEADFWHLANSTVEKSFALGLGALTIGVEGLEVGEDTKILKKKGHMVVESLNAFQIVPISKVGGHITECAFQSVDAEDNTTLVIHTMDEKGEYVIRSYVYTKENQNPTATEFLTHSNIPWFFILQPSLESNFIYDSGQEADLGMSVFANAIDVMKTIDMIYDVFATEFLLKQPRAYVTETAMKNIPITLPDGTKSAERGFDPNDKFFYVLPGEAEDDKAPYLQFGDSEFRAQSLIEGINKNLNLFAMKIGLGNYFKFDGGSIMTATQVISENSEMFRNVKKHEKLLENVMIKFTKAFMNASNLFTNTTYSDIELDKISVQFDDSIFEDTDTEKKRDREDVAAALMSEVEYRMKWLGETEKEANKNYAKFFPDKLIEKYGDSYAQGLMTPEDFVELAYPGAKDKQAIVTFLADNKKAASEFNINGQFDSEGSTDDDEDNEDDKEDME